MTTADKVIKTKVGLLELGKQLGNVSKACRMMGYHPFLSIQKALDRWGSGACGNLAQQTELKKSY